MTTLKTTPRSTDQVNLFLKFLNGVKLAKAGDSFVIEVNQGPRKSYSYFFKQGTKLSDQTIGGWVKDIQKRISHEYA